MHAHTFDLNTYLQRIDYHGEPAANLDSLTALMRHQLMTIPFENLDVQAGKIVSMDPDHIADKLLRQGRGGYCYEVNGLFAMALQALGIRYWFAAARPMFYPTRRPRTHLVVIAELQGRRWLCDLGFGSHGIRAPIALDLLDTDLQQDDDCYRLSQGADGELVLSAQVDGAWLPQYALDGTPQAWIDFAPANYMNSTHPDAIFVQKLLVILHYPQGRWVLLGDSFKTIDRGHVTRQHVDASAVPALLHQVFKLPVGLGKHCLGQRAASSSIALRTV